jgi:glycine oxidase
VQDAVVIGGGVIGLAVALELERRGVHTLVLERGSPGEEASGAAAGMLAPQVEASAPGPGFKLGLLSREMYRGWIASIEALSETATGYHADGALQLVEGRDSLEAAWQRAVWQRDLGLRVERLDRGAVLERVPGLGEEIAGAIHYPDEAQVDPRRLVRALALAARAAHAEIRSGAEVQRIVVEDGRVIGLDLEDQHIPAKLVILAAGAWSSLLPGGELPVGIVRPARGQIVVLDPGSAPCRPYLSTSHGYLVPRRDGRVLVGSTTEYVGYNRSVTAEGVQKLLQFAIRVLPSLGEARLVETWAGLRPWSQDHLPILGHTRIEGLVMATGHFRNGILQAPATARLIADQVTERRPDLDLVPFAIDRFLLVPATRSTPPAAVLS